MTADAPRWKMIAFAVLLFALAAIAYILLQGASHTVPLFSMDGIPLPFGSEQIPALKGSIVDVGERNGIAVRIVSFDDEGDSSELLQGASHSDSIDFIVTPDSPTVSDGAKLCEAITANKRYFGYQYADRSATSEKAAAERAKTSPVPFSELFPGQFFASPLERAAGSFIANFEAQRGIVFKNPCDVMLKKNARYILIVNDTNTEFAARNVAWCGSGTQDNGEVCDDGNSVSGDGCSDECVVEPHFNCNGIPSVCVSTLVCSDVAELLGRDTTTDFFGAYVSPQQPYPFEQTAKEVFKLSDGSFLIQYPVADFVRVDPSGHTMARRDFGWDTGMMRISLGINEQDRLLYFLAAGVAVTNPSTGTIDWSQTPFIRKIIAVNLDTLATVATYDWPSQVPSGSESYDAQRYRVFHSDAMFQYDAVRRMFLITAAVTTDTRPFVYPANDPPLTRMPAVIRVPLPVPGVTPFRPEDIAILPVDVDTTTQAMDGYSPYFSTNKRMFIDTDAGTLFALAGIETLPLPSSQSFVHARSIKKISYGGSSMRVDGVWTPTVPSGVYQKLFLEGVGGDSAYVRELRMTRDSSDTFHTDSIKLLRLDVTTMTVAAMRDIQEYWESFIIDRSKPALYFLANDPFALGSGNTFVELDPETLEQRARISGVPYTDSSTVTVADPSATNIRTAYRIYRATPAAYSAVKLTTGMSFIGRGSSVVPNVFLTQMNDIRFARQCTE